MAKVIEVTFTGVETPRRMANVEDTRRGIVRHTFDVPAANISADVLVHLDGPNPRTPNTKKKAAKGLKESLQGVDVSTLGAFHLAHGGIRALVSGFKKLDDTTYLATFKVDTGMDSEDDGIANGLHTIAVVQKAMLEGQIPPEQYLTFTLIENAPRDLIPYVAEGLNTSIQVAEESILNLGNKFEPFKTAIANKPYADEIGWKENDQGDYDARDVFAILNALNVERWSNDNRDHHPVESYEKQSACITAFKAEQKKKEKDGTPSSFEAMIHMLPEALTLYDTIRFDAYERYQDEVKDGKPWSLAIMEARRDRNGKAKTDVWTFPFISESAEYKRHTYRLSKGVTFATLAAFRNFVRLDRGTGRMEWIGGFAAVLTAWKVLGGEMVVAAKETSAGLNFNPNAVGKHRPFWRQLHQRVATYRLEQETAALRKELEEMKSKG